MSVSLFDLAVMVVVVLLRRGSIRGSHVEQPMEDVLAEGMQHDDPQKERSKHLWLQPIFKPLRYQEK